MQSLIVRSRLLTSFLFLFLFTTPAFAVTLPGVGEMCSETSTTSDTAVCCAPPGKTCKFCDENPEECHNKRTLMLIVPGMGNSEKSENGEFVLRKDAPELELMNRLKRYPCVEARALPFDEDQPEKKVHEELTEKKDEIFEELGLSADPGSSAINGVLIVGYSQGGIAALGIMEQLEGFQATSGLSMEFHTYGTPFNLNYGSAGPTFFSELGIIGEFTSSVVASGEYYKPKLEGNIPHTQHIHTETSSWIGVEEQRTGRLPWPVAHVNERYANHQSVLKRAELLVPRQCRCSESFCAKEEASQLQALGKIFSAQ